MSSKDVPENSSVSVEDEDLYLKKRKQKFVNIPKHLRTKKVPKSRRYL